MNSPEEKSPEEIEAEIARTRAELGDTVADIADKADVKKQAGRKAEELKGQAKEKIEQAKEKAEAVVGGSSADPYGGSGGDIGSGPTGDVRNSPSIVQSDHQTLAIVAGAFAAGLILGRILWR